MAAILTAEEVDLKLTQGVVEHTILNEDHLL